MRYKVGDRVKIKGDLRKCACVGQGMDKWKGKEMTIRGIENGYYKMREDVDDFRGNATPGWDWYGDTIEGLAEPESLEEFIMLRMIEAGKKARQEWEESHKITQLVYGVHKLGGKEYTWRNPDNVPVSVGKIVKVDAGGKKTPVIVTRIESEPLSVAKRYKKVLGVY